MKLRPPIFFLRNSLSDQWLLIKALMLVWAVRLGLWVLPLRTLREIIAKSTSKASVSEQVEPTDSQLVARLVSSIRRVSKYVPAASCLTQALATQILVGRRGQPASLQIGVTKSAMGNLRAHAWLESNGEIIIGRVKDQPGFVVLSQPKEAGQ